jgi:hypothetical protein
MIATASDTRIADLGNMACRNIENRVLAAIGRTAGIWKGRYAYGTAVSISRRQ